MKVSLVILSKTPPAALIEELSKQTFKRFEIICATEKGTVKAMNSALARAKGSIFIRIDDDIHPDKNWLKELVMPFADNTVTGVTGPTYIPRDRRHLRDSIAFVDKYRNNPILKWLFDYNVLAPAKIYKCGSVSYGSNFVEAIRPDRVYKIDHLEGTNWAMRTELIRKAGGFDEAFDGTCEWFDDDVVYKLRKMGHSKLVYNPKAVVWHMIERGEHYKERFEAKSRLKNWLRFHYRHSRFHYKKAVWFALIAGYMIMSRNKGGER
jgi:GT2 family glycosyltransferase